VRRLIARIIEDHAYALLVTPEVVDDFYARFNEPDGQGERFVPVGSC
jgi:hypothetical protein